jgi:precorrin isomerase
MNLDFDELTESEQKEALVMVGDLDTIALELVSLLSQQVSDPSVGMLVTGIMLGFVDALATKSGVEHKHRQHGLSLSYMHGLGKGSQMFDVEVEPVFGVVVSTEVPVTEMD